jgi:hypothetical protein
MIGSLMALAACGSARVIQRTQAGGVIELSGDRGKAMEQANQEMAGHCGPNNFTVVQEGEEAVGTDTFTREDESTDSKTSKNGRRSATDTTTTGQQSTRTATAWRVRRPPVALPRPRRPRRLPATAPDDPGSRQRPVRPGEAHARVVSSRVSSRPASPI